MVLKLILIFLTIENYERSNKDKNRNKIDSGIYIACKFI